MRDCPQLLPSSILLPYDCASLGELPMSTARSLPEALAKFSNCFSSSQLSDLTRLQPSYPHITGHQGGLPSNHSPPSDSASHGEILVRVGMPLPEALAKFSKCFIILQLRNCPQLLPSRVGEQNELMTRVPQRTERPTATVQLTVVKSEADYFEAEVPVCSAGFGVFLDRVHLQWSVPWDVWLMADIFLYGKNVPRPAPMNGVGAKENE